MPSAPHFFWERCVLQLRPRLHTIATLVQPGACLADIGTDHAYLPVWLLRQGIISHAIAADLREGPLARGMAVARRYGMSEEQISFRCCDGLQGLQRGEADAIVMAGMGGDTIVHCLAACPWRHDKGLTFFLQAMSALPELRTFLASQGFCIQEEYLAREQARLYVVMKVVPGSMAPLSLGERWAGRQHPGMPRQHRSAYLNETITRREHALQGMRQANRREMETEMAQTEEILKDLYRMREEFLAW